MTSKTNINEFKSNDSKIKQIIDKSSPKRNIFKNAIFSFLIGGLICLLAQIITEILKNWFDKDLAGNISVTIMVFIGSLLTGFGLYDKIGQIAGAGTIIPITGFSNSMTSSALESKSEGLILGIVTNMFKLAGSVIVVGVVSAFFIGSIIYLSSLIF